jgi:hypothetical protein
MMSIRPDPFNPAVPEVYTAILAEDDASYNSMPPLVMMGSVARYDECKHRLERGVKDIGIYALLCGVLIGYLTQLVDFGALALLITDRKVASLLKLDAESPFNDMLLVTTWSVMTVLIVRLVFCFLNVMIVTAVTSSSKDYNSKALKKLLNTLERCFVAGSLIGLSCGWLVADLMVVGVTLDILFCFVGLALSLFVYLSLCWCLGDKRNDSEFVDEKSLPFIVEV